MPLIKEAIANGEPFSHAFEYTCATNDIEHRTTKVKHPWTNGQVERMNRTINIQKSFNKVYKFFAIIDRGQWYLHLESGPGTNKG